VNKDFLIVLSIITFIGCSEKYDVSNVGACVVKIDRKINAIARSEIIKQLKSNLEKGLLINPDTLKEIAVDSILFSYLFSFRTVDLHEKDLFYTKLMAYSTFLSKDVLQGLPVHYLDKNTGKYMRYDTSTVIIGDNHVVLGSFDFYSKRLEFSEINVIGRLFVTKLHQVNPKLNIPVSIERDSVCYFVRFTLPRDTLIALNFKKELEKLDQKETFIGFYDKSVKISFNDTLGEQLASGIYFRRN
jgi:hypothetical protein